MNQTPCVCLATPILGFLICLQVSSGVGPQWVIAWAQRRNMREVFFRVGTRRIAVCSPTASNPTLARRSTDT